MNGDHRLTESTMVDEIAEKLRKVGGSAGLRSYLLNLVPVQ